MRTTLNLADALAEAAKAKAAAEGRTLTSVIEEGLRAVLDEEVRRGSPPLPLPTWGSGSGAVLVDLHDRERLWDVLDEAP